ncbi:YeeE/YedE thiosulfate transporter family protein [Sinanaerobacter chloroacetimidivorans]|uniref:YeeE/YedE family protein n=1 Tax=Sinanaerobacter chloroacetimidivorans TaxID=2818044 RepID=A0A8J7VY39_9FIRM|nr:YeeE/YedE thiosulfate transporter family protein [Sinanaerobacter chloroacetimidivorans]MBR0597164.1 YeeE/YedE family protein [Sinanaerobacter chloroacetimidivorans]
MKKIWEKLEKNQYYTAIFKNPFTYVTGAVLLSILQIALLATSGNPWGVSGPFTNWGAWLFEALGGSVDKWFYFSSAGAQNTLNGGFLNDTGSIQNVGIIVGALMATLLASQFKFKKIKSVRQVIAAVLGGLLMGYGARLAFGCNIGALFSGIASLSLSGWVFALSLLIGAYIGSKLLAKFFM